METLGSQKIAILGGAFDPITRGHLQIAHHVLSHCDRFDRIWLMPCYSHVYNKQMTPPRHRLAMCELAAGKERRIEVSAYEIQHRCDQGTYALMQELTAAWEVEFSLIIGLDNANTFHKWLNYRRLQELVSFVVVPRRGISPMPGVDWYRKPPHLYLDQGSEIMEVSSTVVRAALAEGRRPTSLVDEVVLDYIFEQGLYGTD